MNIPFSSDKHKTFLTFPAPDREQFVPMDGFGERLSARARRLGISDAEVARRAALTPRRYSNYVTNKREPAYATLVTIAAVLETTPDELLGLSADRTPVVSRSIDSLSFLNEDFAAIPAYDLRVSAGPGSVNYDGDPEHRHLFRLEWLRSVTNTAPSRLAVVRVTGDSMWPTLHDGDHVLIDRAVGQMTRDGLYVMRLAGQDLQVKRITRAGRTKLLTIKSDNPDYPTDEGVRDADIEVLGRVIWLGRNIGG